MEIVRRCNESLTRGDDAWLELVAPDFVVDFSRRRVDPFVLHGVDDPLLATLRSQTLEIWEELPAWEPEELIASGPKCCLDQSKGRRIRRDERMRPEVLRSERPSAETSPVPRRRPRHA